MHRIDSEVDPGQVGALVERGGEAEDQGGALPASWQWGCNHAAGDGFDCQGGSPESGGDVQCLPLSQEREVGGHGGRHREGR